jgi:transposase InsO family protein
MPWKEESTMDKKVSFIVDYLNNRCTSFTDLCSHYGISRRIGYKFLNRYLENDVDGLKERSRRPHNSPNKTAPEIEQAIVDVRIKHPDRGARKLVVPIHKQHPEWILPTEATINNILSRNGLINESKRRFRLQHPGRPYTAVTAANQLWGIDFKGEFKMLNGEYCFPLTITDSFSRYIICCKGLPCTKVENTKRAMEIIFKEYGLPERIRSDNGIPFSSPISLGRLSTLSVWWIRLGIFPELIEPASPQQNGRHERMHRTLKANTTRPPAYNFRSQQNKFDTFVQDFNTDRPHEALGQKTPSEFYTPSNREYPTKLPPVEYPSHFEVRRVARNGGVRWKNRWIRASNTLAEEYIAFEEVDNDLYNVYFSFVLIGRFQDRDHYINTFRTNNRYDFEI